MGWILPLPLVHLRSFVVVRSIFRGVKDRTTILAPKNGLTKKRMSGPIHQRKATIQAKRRVRKQTQTPTPVSVGITVESSLSSFKGPKGTTLLTPEEVKVLMDTGLFTTDNQDFTMQILGQMAQLGFRVVYDSIKAAKNQKEAFFLSPAMEEPLARVIAHDERFLADAEVASGVFTCPNKMCKSDRIISAQSQVSRTDEPMTTFLRCTKCGTQWTRR